MSDQEWETSVLPADVVAACREAVASVDAGVPDDVYLDIVAEIIGWGRLQTIGEEPVREFIEGLL